MSSFSDLYDLQTTCRSCLRHSNKLFSLDECPNNISDGQSIVNTQKTIGELMMACTNVEVCIEKTKNKQNQKCIH